MCGFIGALGLEGKRPHIPHSRLEETLLAKRGPDEMAEFADQDSIVRFYRLRTVGASRTLGELRFPLGMAFCLLNGTLHRRRQLQPDSPTDHEALAQAFRKEGELCFSRLVGGFACCIKTTSKLLLATDATGEKSLCWAETGTALWFSTSPLLLACHLGRPPISGQHLLFHLALRGQPLGASYFGGIRQLRPGSVLSASATAIEIHRWPAYCDVGPSPWCDRLHDALAEKMGDGHTGIALSGGVDSSLLAAIGATNAKAGYCATLESSADPALGDDQLHARAVAASLRGVEFLTAPSGSHLDVTAPRDFPVLDQDEHGLDAIACVLRSAGCNVLASGDGADELFCGYDRIYRFGIGLDSENVAWPLARRRFLERYSYLDLAFLERNVDTRPFAEFIDSMTRYLIGLCPKPPTRFRMVYHWFLRHHLFWLLRKLDFVCGNHGMESRAPYLHPAIVKSASALSDSELVPYAKLLPGDEGYHRHVKRVIKDHLGHLIHHSILARPKQPFPYQRREAEDSYLESLGSSPQPELPPALHAALLEGKGGSYPRLLYLSYLCWKKSCADLTI